VAFVTVEHWNAECVGWPVAKHGDRYAALEPLAQGVTRYYGGVEADAARGLAVRLDHGTQYLSDHFVNQLRFWGVTPSFAFVAEPETNGVAERFIRTLKEQAIYGRIFRTAAEVRAAVATFVTRYNAEWRLEKTGFRSPLQVRAAWTEAAVPVAA
jgi:putative transposase